MFFIRRVLSLLKLEAVSFRNMKKVVKRTTNHLQMEDGRYEFYY